MKINFISKGNFILKCIFSYKNVQLYLFNKLEYIKICLQDLQHNVAALKFIFDPVVIVN